MDKHSIRTNGLNQLITFLKSNLEGQTETEYKVKMQDRLGSVNLREVRSYPSTRFLEYLKKELKELDDTEEFTELFNDALKYTIVHLGFSGNEELIEDLVENVEQNYIAENFEVYTEFEVDDFAEIGVNPTGIEDYSYLKIIPVLDGEEIGKFELNPPYKCPVLPLQVKCRYKGTEISKVFDSSSTKKFDFSQNRRAGLEIDNVDKILDKSKGEEEEAGDKDSEEIYVCENCGDEFLSEAKLEEHLKAQKTVQERNKVQEDSVEETDQSDSEEVDGKDKNPRKILNKKSFALITLIALSVFTFLSFTGSPPEDVDRTPTGVNDSESELPSVEKLNFNQLEDSIRTQINQVRDEQNLSNLSQSTKLSSIADRHAESITDRENLTHYSSEGLNTTERFREAGYICTNFDVGENFKGAENIYRTTYGFSGESTEGALNSSEELTQDIVDGLIEDEEARELILNPELNFQGVGVHAEEADGSEAREIYAVQDLC